jgi:hypothetical protein
MLFYPVSMELARDLDLYLVAVYRYKLRLAEPSVITLLGHSVFYEQQYFFPNTFLIHTRPQNTPKNRSGYKHAYPQVWTMCFIINFRVVTVSCGGLLSAFCYPIFTRFSVLLPDQA